MKKLVTVCALCAAMSAMAIDSQNVVGYQTITIPQGYSIVTGTFIPVGSAGSSIKLGDIVPNASFASGADTIAFLNPDGSGSFTTIAYYYVGYGWYDIESNDLNGQSIPKGASFLVSTGGTGVKFTLKGEVYKTAFSIAVPQGVSLVGNCVPKDIKLGDIVPNASFVSGADTLAFLNPDGSGNFSTTAYYYVGYGWYDIESNNLNAQVLPTGASFVISVGSTGVQLAFPAAY